MDEVVRYYAHGEYINPLKSGDWLVDSVRSNFFDGLEGVAQVKISGRGGKIELVSEDYPAGVRLKRGEDMQPVDTTNRKFALRPRYIKIDEEELGHRVERTQNKLDWYRQRVGRD